MRSFRQMSFAVCAAATLTTTGAAAFGLPSPSPGPLIVLFHDQSNFASSRRESVPCRISPAQAERMERTTADPCLAADSVPGGVCFERLGNDTPTDAPATLQLRDLRRGPRQERTPSAP